MEMLTVKEDVLDAKMYLYFREQVEFKKLSMEQAERAVRNSLKTFVVYKDEEPVGMGRIVGDGAVVCYIQDLIVIPSAQGHRIGSRMIDRIIAYAKSIRVPGTELMLCLMCAKGREPFYIHHNFIPRPNDGLGPGMIQYITD